MNETDEQALLKAKAIKLLDLLTRYADSDKDVNITLQDVLPFIDKVKMGEIFVPQKFPWDWVFFRGENNLMNYPDLINAAADFSRFLAGEKKT